MFFRKRKSLITLNIGRPVVVKPPEAENPEEFVLPPADEAVRVDVEAQPRNDIEPAAVEFETFPEPLLEVPEPALPETTTDLEAPEAEPVRVEAAAVGPFGTPARPFRPAVEEPPEPAFPPPAPSVEILEPPSYTPAERVPTAAAPTRQYPVIAPPDDVRIPSVPLTGSGPGEPVGGESPAGLFDFGAEVEYTQCPYCFRNVPVGASRCEDCGSELISLDDDEDLYLEEGAPTLRPVGQAETPQAEPGEPETRPLSGRPSPSILKETTIMIPAQLSLLDSFERKAEKTFTLRIGATNIGRGTDNELSFPEEEFISRHHCQIAFHRYQYVLKDLQSANGTFVNDVKIQETILRDGDNIQIGSLRFIFEDPVERMKKKRMGAH